MAPEPSPPTHEYRYGPRSASIVRLAISSFILVVIALAVTGLVWTSSNQPPAQSAASRVVLGLCIVAGVAGLGAVWQTKAAR